MKITLLVDNAPWNKNIKTSNIEICLFATGMSEVLQNSNAGIIRTFKAAYRRQQMNFLIDHFDIKIKLAMLR